MIYDWIIVRYGEIFLKGNNRPIFESKLMQNITAMTGQRVKKLQSRLMMPYFQEHSRLRRVFGLVSYSPSIKAEKNLEEIKKKTLQLIADKKGTFRVDTQRSDKKFPGKSPEINREIGKYIEDNTQLVFSLHDPQITINLEINQEGAYLFLDTISCPGGIPTGVEGKVLLLIENEASILAGILMMKRGCSIIPVSFKAADISLLQRYSPEKINLVLIKNETELERIATGHECSVLASGQNFNKYKKYPFSLLALRPLISYSDERINEESRSFSLI